MKNKAKCDVPRSMRSLDRFDDIAGCCALAFPRFCALPCGALSPWNAEELGVKKLMADLWLFWCLFSELATLLSG